MRLSEWQARTPHRELMAEVVMAPVRDALALLGGEPDPDCWIVWGDDPQVRWTVLIPSAAGLIQLNVRVNVPGEGPRSVGKLIRWHRVQIGEVSAEVHGTHRLLSFQVESQLLHSADADADELAAFVETLFAKMDGRRVSVQTPDVIELSGPRPSEP